MDPGGSHTPGPDPFTGQGYELVSPIGYLSSSSCGYCGNKGQNSTKRFSYYAEATSLSPRFYQTLLDRYWRRSGTLMYRPDQRKSCCPHYTIRLDSSEFKPSRAQRQTINRFNNFVLGETYIKEAARLYPKTKEEAKRRDNEFQLVERVHEAEHERLKTPPEPAHKLEITLEDDGFTEEKYRVWDNYQKVVHHDPPKDRTRRAFERFLCSSPLRRETLVDADGKERRLGSYHQCYRLDGKLVAIGVLDLLPQCVSSVYFLYDESVHKYAPGKLGALQEIALATEGGYRWWYPGYYIHSCPKMKYKMDYTPQYILDPVALSWDPLDRQVLDKLDKQAFFSLSLYKKKSAATFEKADNEFAAEDDDCATDAEVEGGDEIREFLFNSSMPGIPPLELMELVDLNHIALRISKDGPVHETSDLVAWSGSTISDFPGIRPAVAELVAAMGVDAASSICLDFAKR